MNIYFFHNGKRAAANLCYNFKEVDDCVLVSFKDQPNDDILFSKTNEEWHSVADLQMINPVTYLNIQEAILNHFKSGDFFDDMRLQAHLY